MTRQEPQLDQPQAGLFEQPVPERPPQQCPSQALHRCPGSGTNDGGSSHRSAEITVELDRGSFVALPAALFFVSRAMMFVRNGLRGSVIKALIQRSSKNARGGNTWVTASETTILVFVTSKCAAAANLSILLVVFALY